MAPLTRLVSTAYGHTAPSYHRGGHPKSLDQVQAFISWFVHTHLFFKLSEGPYSLLAFIAVFVAVCMTLVIAVVFVGGSGRRKGDGFELRGGKMPERMDKCEKGLDGYRGMK